MQTLYRLWDKHNQLLYVGISSKWYERLHAHEKNQEWWEQVAQVTLQNYETREAVVEAEKIAIKTERPLHNRQHSHTFEGNQDHFDKLKFYIHYDVPVDDQHKELIDFARDFYTHSEFYQVRGKKSVDVASILLSGFADVPDSLECVNCQSLNYWVTLKNWRDISFKAFIAWDYKREVEEDGTD
jgi:predicted GIY-YIG superfamily endonuclease